MHSQDTQHLIFQISICVHIIFLLANPVTYYAGNLPYYFGIMFHAFQLL